MPNYYKFLKAIYRGNISNGSMEPQKKEASAKGQNFKKNTRTQAGWPCADIFHHQPGTSKDFWRARFLIQLWPHQKLLFSFFFFLSLFILREREREREQAGERQRERERERIPSRLSTASAELDVGSNSQTIRS